MKTVSQIVLGFTGSGTPPSGFGAILTCGASSCGKATHTFRSGKIFHSPASPAKCRKSHSPVVRRSKVGRL